MEDKQKLAERAERIVRFRESLTLLPDERFFEIIRTYLGQIQSPYNKTNLIEKLSAVFRKEQNQRRIISFLSDFDIKMLSVVSIVSDANQEKITDFFSKDYTLSEIYAELLSLSERLLIYSYRNPETQKKVIGINPLLENALSPYLGLNELLPESVCAVRNLESDFSLSPQFVASYVSFILSNPEMCKNDLSIRKKESERLESIFPERKEVLSLLLNAFLNLGIAKFSEKSLLVDENRLKKFAELSEISQYVYLSAASAVHLGREGLRIQCELLLDVAATIPEKGFTLSSLMNTAFLLSNRNETLGSERKRSSFSKILEARRTIDFNFDTNDYSAVKNPGSYSGKIIEKIINNAIVLGLFSVYGKTESGENIYVRSEVFKSDESNKNSENGTEKRTENFGAFGSGNFKDGKTESENSADGKKGLLNINAGTVITIMPGLSLSELIPFTIFLEVQKNSVVSEFEISRKSVSRAFDKNISPDEIISLLEKYSAYEIPQNLKMNIEEWHKSYTSAMLFKGYVLKVDEKTSRIIEKNPNVVPYIQQKLSDGIYLLNIPLDGNIDLFIETSGLEFMGNVKKPERKAESMDFPRLQKGRSIISGSLSVFGDVCDVDEVDCEVGGEFEIRKEKEEKLERLKELSEEGNKTKAEFQKILRSLGFSKQQEDVLSARIEKGVILSEEQLKAETVRLEILEADGMNYAGKVRLVENAISAGDSLEIFMPADRSGSVMKTFVGKPILISKNSGDCLLKFQTEPDGDIKLFSVSMANRIRLIKTSVFN